MSSRNHGKAVEMMPNKGLEINKEYVQCYDTIDKTNFETNGMPYPCTFVFKLKLIMDHNI